MKENKTSFHLLLTLFALMVTSSVFVNMEEVWADEVIATIPSGQWPYAVQYNPSNNYIYVANDRSDNVSIIDSITNEIIATVDVGDGPWALEYNPYNNNIYVSNRDSDEVSIIDSITNEIIATVDVGDEPREIAFNPSNEHIYVVNAGSAEVSVIDSSNNTVIATIEVGNIPIEIEYNPSNENMYVSAYYSGFVYVIDSSSNTVIATVDVGSWPTAVEYNPSNENMYVVNSGSDNAVGLDDVSVIDSSSNTVIATIEVGNIKQAEGSLLFNPSNENIYVVNHNSDDVSVIDSSSNTVIATIKGFDFVSNFPGAIEYNPQNNNLYVAETKSVSIINSFNNSIIETVNVGINPTDIEYSSANDYIYVANRQTGEISVIGTLFPTLKPIADAGPDQVVQSENMVQLDGSNSSDSNDSALTYSWIQTEGPEVVLSDSTSSNPTFEAPKTNEEINLVFQLTVTNEEGVTSEPDEVIVTVNPVAMPPPPPSEEEPRTINDIIKGIIKNPLNVTNSVESSKEIRDLLTDDNQNNDKIVCNLLGERADSIREILKC